jgi:hypothetical protein
MILWWVHYATNTKDEVSAQRAVALERSGRFASRGDVVGIAREGWEGYERRDPRAGRDGVGTHSGTRTRGNTGSQ